ncbi:uncharacterized protein LOC135340861 isoform X2 [Halichondria panicea]|uniref:uncharacterized protein LOC135340861 isoform X2 n=1 Tax=Halichondria panicea TaxID=6063 RepID=UPI00312BB11F
MHDMCTDCGGSGIKVTHRPLGPVMMQQIQSVCTHCGGSGDYIRDKDKCKKCKGKCLVEINHKQENTAGDDHSDKLDHTDYRRVDCDLFVEKNISLREALCGFTYTLYPLDGRNVGVSRSPGAVLSPGVGVSPVHRTWPHQHWTQRQRKWI